MDWNLFSIILFVIILILCTLSDLLFIFLKFDKKQKKVIILTLYGLIIFLLLFSLIINSIVHSFSFNTAFFIISPIPFLTFYGFQITKILTISQKDKLLLYIKKQQGTFFARTLYFIAILFFNFQFYMFNYWVFLSASLLLFLNLYVYVFTILNEKSLNDNKNKENKIVNNKSDHNNKKNSQLILGFKKETIGIGFYFFNTIFLSWYFWLSGAFSGLTINEWPILIFYFIGGTSPLLTGLLLILSKNKQEQKNFWKRVTEINRLKITWAGIILAVLLIPSLISAILDYYLLIDGVGFTGVITFFTNFTTILNVIVFAILTVIAEEPGWRGFALEELQIYFSPVIASLFIAFYWAIWHVPLYVLPGTFQEQFGLYSYEFLLYTVGFIPATFFITWVYNFNSKSIFSAMIVHALINIIGEIFDLGIYGETMRLGIFTIATIIIMVLFRKGTKKSTPITKNSIKE